VRRTNPKDSRKRCEERSSKWQAAIQAKGEKISSEGPMLRGGHPQARFGRWAGFSQKKELRQNKRVPQDLKNNRHRDFMVCLIHEEEPKKVPKVTAGEFNSSKKSNVRRGYKKKKKEKHQGRTCGEGFRQIAGRETLCRGKKKFAMNQGSVANFSKSQWEAGELNERPSPLGAVGRRFPGSGKARPKAKGAGGQG